MKDLDEEIWNRIKVILSNPARLLEEWLSTPAADKDSLEKVFEHIKAEIRGNQLAIGRLVNRFALESNEDIRNEVHLEIKRLGNLTDKLKEEASVIKAQLDTASGKVHLLKEMEHSEFTRDILCALDRLSDKDRKHIVRIILSPEDGGKIFLRAKRPADDHVGDPAVLSEEFFEEISGAFVADWSFKLRAEKITAAIPEGREHIVFKV